VLYFYGEQPALEFFTGYLIEKALSVDNLFLFLVIFRAFAVDERLRHRLLEWGVVGALIMRGVMIALGAELIEHFSWGCTSWEHSLSMPACACSSTTKGTFTRSEAESFGLPAAPSSKPRISRGGIFSSATRAGCLPRLYFLVLLVVEITDVTLAVDSIPAVFGITRDPFYCLYVKCARHSRASSALLSAGGVIDRLRFLDEGLAIVLVLSAEK